MSKLTNEELWYALQSTHPKSGIYAWRVGPQDIDRNQPTTMGGVQVVIRSVTTTREAAERLLTVKGREWCDQLAMEIKYILNNPHG